MTLFFTVLTLCTLFLQGTYSNLEIVFMHPAFVYVKHSKTYKILDNTFVSFWLFDFFIFYFWERAKGQFHLTWSTSLLHKSIAMMEDDYWGRRVPFHLAERCSLKINVLQMAIVWHVCNNLKLLPKFSCFVCMCVSRFENYLMLMHFNWYGTVTSIQF